jgi:hypothetical protein
VALPDSRIPYACRTCARCDAALQTRWRVTLVFRCDAARNSILVYKHSFFFFLLMRLYSNPDCYIYFLPLAWPGVWLYLPPFILFRLPPIVHFMPFIFSLFHAHTLPNSLSSPSALWLYYPHLFPSFLPSFVTTKMKTHKKERRTHTTGQYMADRFLLKSCCGMCVFVVSQAKQKCRSFHTGRGTASKSKSVPGTVHAANAQLPGKRVAPYEQNGNLFSK